MTRTELILTIFADRAHSHEGQLQVELAQLKHAQTRLVRGWTHLDRQKGGIGLRGAGEKQIELDQRMLSMRIKAFEKKLTDVAKRRSQNRRGRNRRGVPTVALVGYTNAGKSTLLSKLSAIEVKIGAYPFTTLKPNLSFMEFDDFSRIYLADIPGIITNAHDDRGLGLSFLCSLWCCNNFKRWYSWYFTSIFIFSCTSWIVTNTRKYVTKCM